MRKNIHAHRFDFDSSVVERPLRMRKDREFDTRRLHSKDGASTSYSPCFERSNKKEALAASLIPPPPSFLCLVPMDSIIQVSSVSLKKLFTFWLKKTN